MGEGSRGAAVLVVDEPDAPEQARQRGAEAAQRFFEAAGVTAYEAAAAAFKRDGIQDGDIDPDAITAAEWRNAELWEEVRAVVARAMYPGQADAPEVVHLKLMMAAAG